MEEKKYLKLYNKVGYGGGDFAANMVYGLISSFVMIYLTNTIGMDAGIIGTLILVSKLLDGVTDILFGSLIDRTHSKFGKARPWMFWSYFGNAIALIALFAIPMNLSSKLQYAYFFIAYTLLNAIFYTANNIAYSALTSLITKNSQERVQMGTFRFIGSTLGNLLVSNFTLVMVEKFGGGNVGWRTTAIIFALIGLVVNTISVLNIFWSRIFHYYHTNSISCMLALIHTVFEACINTSPRYHQPCILIIIQFFHIPDVQPVTLLLELIDPYDIFFYFLRMFKIL